jgi:hypothetical protein
MNPNKVAAKKLSLAVFTIIEGCGGTTPWAKKMNPEQGGGGVELSLACVYHH